jgi:hypothetical protein
MCIKLSKDRKVQGVEGEANSIGLVPGVDCPGETEACAKCYGKRGFMAYPNAVKVYTHNSQYLRELLKKDVKKAAREVADEIKKHNKSNLFRWQIGGDIFGVKHLDMIVRVCNLTPDILHWIYTRSFIQFVKYYTRHREPLPSNLRFNLSYDRFNVESALDMAGIIGKAKWLEEIEDVNVITWMGDKKEAQKHFPLWKWITCPADAGKIELQGACAECTLCFKEHKKRIAIHFPTCKAEGRK